MSHKDNFSIARKLTEERAIEKKFSKACETGDLKSLKALIENYPDFDLHNEDLYMLGWAAYNNQLGIIKYLVEEKKVDPNALSDDALRSGAEQGHLDVVKYFIEQQGADPHVWDEAPLCWAARGNHIDVVEYMVEHCNADLHCQDDRALLWAAERENWDIVKYLLEQGVDYRAVEPTEERRATQDTVLTPETYEHVKQMGETVVARKYKQQQEQTFVENMAHLKRHSKQAKVASPRRRPKP